MGSAGASVRRSLAACLLAASGGALAQAGQPAMELVASSAQLCLQPAEAGRAKPVYPPDQLKFKQGLSVEAEFVFNAPDRPPEVRFKNELPQGYRDSVEAYAQQLRVPCISPGADPVKLRQAFDFVPNDGRKVAWTTAKDEADDERREAMRCLVRPSAEQEIEYPDILYRHGIEGVVMVKLRFVDPAQPPRVDVLYDGGDEDFVKALSTYIGKLRLPCLHGTEVTTRFNFDFKVRERPKRSGHILNDLSLPNFLHAVDAIPAGSVFFDTTTMRCPFDVRLTFEQPFDANKVEELEEDVPARHAFLDWLGKQHIRVGPEPVPDLIGQPMTIHVPCATIDL